MGDLAVDTQLTPVEPGAEGERRSTLDLSDDWRIWTLNGGYVAAVALRAAGEATELPRPATLSLQLLRGAVAGPAEVVVRSVRRARGAECLAVALTQGGRPVAEGHVWAVDDDPSAPSHQDAGDRPAGPPLSYPTMQERVAEREAATGVVEDRPDFPFWHNLDVRPTRYIADWASRVDEPALAVDWLRFVPTATFEDPFLDAGRVAVGLDLYSFPSFVRAHPDPIDWISPNIDLHCTFLAPSGDSSWLLALGRTPSSGCGTAGFTAEVWDEGGRLVATGGGQMLVRTVG